MRSIRTAVAACVLALLLVPSATLAAPTDTFTDFVLDRFGWEGDTPERLVACIQPLDVNLETNDLAVHIDGALYDGAWFIVGWTKTKLGDGQPVMVCERSVEVDGEAVTTNFDYPTSRWSPDLFGLHVAGDPRDGTMSGIFAAALDKDWHGTKEVAVNLTIKRPKAPIAVVDPMLYEDEPDPGHKADIDYGVDLLREAGIAIAGPDELDPDRWVKDGYFVVDYYGSYYMGGETYHGEQFVREGDLDNLLALMEYYPEEYPPADPPDMDEEDICLTFTMDMDRATAPFDADISRTFDDGMTVQIANVWLCPLTTVVQTYWIPDPPTQEAADTYADNVILEFVGRPLEDLDAMRIEDQSGERLARYHFIAGGDYWTGMRAEVQELSPDVWGMPRIYVSPGLIEMPERVYLRFIQGEGGFREAIQVDIP